YCARSQTGTDPCARGQTGPGCTSPAHQRANYQQNHDYNHDQQTGTNKTQMTVKTTPIILFLTCATLVAQTPTLVTNSGSTIDSARGDATPRAAVRDFDAELTNNSKATTNAVAKSNAPAAVAPVASAPAGGTTAAPPSIPVATAPPQP